MLELVAPTRSLHEAWLEAHDEWGPGVHEDGFGLQPSDDVRSVPGFTAWLHRLADTPPTGGRGRNEDRSTLRWIVEENRVLGGVALRHGPQQYVDWAGNIGFGVRPSSRRRGVATWALNQVLEIATTQGMNHVRLVCAADNAASAAMIEHFGAVLEAITETQHRIARRYVIALRSQ